MYATYYVTVFYFSTCYRCESMLDPDGLLSRRKFDKTWMHICNQPGDISDTTASRFPRDVDAVRDQQMQGSICQKSQTQQKLKKWGKRHISICRMRQVGENSQDVHDCLRPKSVAIKYLLLSEFLQWIWPVTKQAWLSPTLTVTDCATKMPKMPKMCCHFVYNNQLIALSKALSKGRTLLRLSRVFAQAWA